MSNTKKAGRPPIDPSLKKSGRTVCLNDKQWQKLVQLGGSKYLQQLLDNYFDNKQS